MNKASGFIFNWIFFVFALISFNQVMSNEFVDQFSLAISDQYLEVSIIIEGGNMRDAIYEGTPIVVDLSEGIEIRLQYSIYNTSEVNVGRLKTVFLFADVSVLSQTNELNFSLGPEDNFTYIQTWQFKDYIGVKDFRLISGTYKVRYDLYYSVGGEDRVLKGTPFYVRFSGNPLTSVPSIMMTVAVAHTGLSVVGLVNTMRSSIPQEVGNSIEATKVSPTKKLIGYYRGSTYSQLQAEVSKSAFAYATKLRRGGKCPQCDTEWPEGHEACSNCNITLEEAIELYSKTLSERSMKAAKEVVDSTSGLSLYNIAQSLGDDVVPTTSIISVLTFSGLTLVQPRVAKSWHKKTRSLLFRGLRIAIYSLFWIQATGTDTLSITTLVIVILSGFILPTVFSTILGFNIRGKVRSYWASNHISPARAK